MILADFQIKSNSAQGLKGKSRNSFKSRKRGMFEVRGKLVLLNGTRYPVELAVLVFVLPKHQVHVLHVVLLDVLDLGDKQLRVVLLKVLKPTGIS